MISYGGEPIIEGINSKGTGGDRLLEIAKQSPYCGNGRALCPGGGATWCRIAARAKEWPLTVDWDSIAN